MPKAKINYYWYGDDTDRDLIAYCNKGTFIKMVKANARFNPSINWIRERVSVTHNEFHLELMKINEGVMIVVEKGFPVKFIPLPKEEVKPLTRKQFNELSKKYEPLYIADETDTNGNFWEVFGFAEVEGEYHKLVKRETQK
jgi:hypothetical protein